MVLILSDFDVARSCTASRAIALIRKAIHAHGEGRLAAPPRTHSAMARGSLVYTAGALAGLVHGVRVYDEADSEEIVAVWDSSTGRLSAVVLGAELGRRRTGAIGAVAIDALARPNAATLGVIGTGNQAWAQVWAATSVRPWRSIAVYSRNSYVRERFAARCREQLLVDAVAVDRPDAAVRGKDAVIVATNSTKPVFDTSWLDPGTHLTTLGPKTISAHEVPLDLLDRVDVAVTDSLAQVHGHPEPYALSTRRMVELGAVITGALPGRTDPEQITLFCSVGLAGTEVVLAADLSGLPTGPAPAMTSALPVVSLIQPDGAEAVAAEPAETEPAETEPAVPNGLAGDAEEEAEEEAVEEPVAAAEPEAAAEEPPTEEEPGAEPEAAAVAEPEAKPAADAEPAPKPEPKSEPEAEHEPDDAGLDLVVPAADAADDEDASSADGRRDSTPEVVTVSADSDDKRRGRDHPRPGKKLPKPRPS